MKQNNITAMNRILRMKKRITENVLKGYYTSEDGIELLAQDLDRFMEEMSEVFIQKRKDRLKHLKNKEG